MTMATLEMKHVYIFRSYLTPTTTLKMEAVWIFNTVKITNLKCYNTMKFKNKV